MAKSRLISPVPHLLSSNTPPTEKETKIVRDALDLAQISLAELKNDFDGDPDAAKDRQLAAAIVETEVYIVKHHSVLSPIRILPPEILEMICKHNLPDTTSRGSTRVLWRENPAFQASHVCQYWRHVVVNAPQLWTTLGDVNLSTATRGDASQRFEYAKFIQDVLRRSSSLDLYMYVHAPDYRPADTRDPDNAVVVHLLEEFHRWHTLAVYGTVNTINLFGDHSLASEPPTPFPRLRELHLRLVTYDHNPQGDNDLRITGFRHSPVLQDFTIWMSMEYTVDLQIPHTVRSYRASPGNSQRITPQLSVHEMLIHDSTTLERLEIEELKYPEGFTVPGLPLASSTLTVLHVESRYSSPSSLHGFLGLLILPSLQELKLRGATGIDTMARWDIASLIARSTRRRGSPIPLRSLTLHALDEEENDLQEILALTPRLEELVIDLVPFLFRYFRSRDDLLRSIRTVQTIVLHAPTRDIYVERQEIHAIANAILNNNDSPKADGTKQERTFRISVPRPSDWQAADAILNFWTDDPDDADQKNISSVLRLWVKDLETILPGLRCAASENERSEDGVLKSLAVLDGVFRGIEGFEIKKLTGQGFIHGSKICHILRPLSQMEENNMIGNTMFNFRERSRKIVQEWESFLKQNKKCRWRGCGKTSLVYVPGGNDGT